MRNWMARKSPQRSGRHAPDRTRTAGRGHAGLPHHIRATHPAATQGTQTWTDGSAAPIMRDLLLRNADRFPLLATTMAIPSATTTQEFGLHTLLDGLEHTIIQRLETAATNQQLRVQLLRKEQRRPTGMDGVVRSLSVLSDNDEGLNYCVPLGDAREPMMIAIRTPHF